MHNIGMTHEEYERAVKVVRLMRDCKKQIHDAFPEEYERTVKMQRVIRDCKKQIHDAFPDHYWYTVVVCVIGGAFAWGWDIPSEEELDNEKGRYQRFF